MNSTLLTALLLQAAAVTLLRYRLGRTWLRRPITLLILAAVLYQGVSAILLAIPSIRVWDNYLIGIEQQYIDTAALIMSVGLLAVVLAYLATRPERVAPTIHGYDPSVAARALDWRLLALACAPLAVLTYGGHGYNSAVVTGPTTALSTDLASTFLITLVVLTAFGFLARHGMRWFVPVLMAQSILLAAAGERTPIAVDAVVLLSLLSQTGLRPSSRQVQITLAMVVLSVLGITGFRAEQGRSLYYSDSGFTARVQAIGRGLYTLVNASNANHTSPGLIAQAAVRLDGNSFAGAILQSMRDGHPKLGSGPVGESMLLVAPSALWPSKLSHYSGLNPTLTQIDDFGLQQVNFLPTLPGLYLGFLGPYWVIAFLAGLGVLCGWGERWLFRRLTVVRLVLVAGAMSAALSYEKGLPGMLIALRAAATLVICMKLIEIARGRIIRPARQASIHVCHEHREELDVGTAS